MPMLAEAGHRVIEADDSSHVLQMVMRRRIDVLMLPADAEPINGEDLLPLVRRLTPGIIIVAGEADEMKMAAALFHGADAYLEFPINADTLLVRLRTLLRARRSEAREQGPPSGNIASGANMTDRTRGPRLVSDETLHSISATLSPTEKRLFARLLEQHGRPIASEDLTLDVWGKEDRRASLRFYIRRLRAKLEPHQLLRILSQKGIGYRLEVMGSAGAGPGL